MKIEYVKTVLYVYPMLKRLAEATRDSAEHKAMLSYRAKGDAFHTALAVAEEYLLADRLDLLKERMRDVLSKLGEEERFFLEYRYFGKNKGKPRTIFCSERNYYRRQRDLLRKVAFELSVHGVREDNFRKDYGGSECMMRILRAVCEGEERGVPPKRSERAIRFQKSPSERSGSGFRPRATKTAMTTTAADTRQMTTISTTERPLPLGVFSSSSGR